MSYAFAFGKREFDKSKCDESSGQSKVAKLQKTFVIFDKKRRNDAARSRFR